MKLALRDQPAGLPLKKVEVWRNRWFQLVHIRLAVTRFKVQASLSKGANPHVLVRLQGAAGPDQELKLKLTPSCAVETYLFRDCSWFYAQENGLLKIVMVSNPATKSTLNYKLLYTNE